MECTPTGAAKAPGVGMSSVHRLQHAPEPHARASFEDIEAVELRMCVEMLERQLAQEEERLANIRRRFDHFNAKPRPASLAPSGPTYATGFLTRLRGLLGLRLRFGSKGVRMVGRR